MKRFFLLLTGIPLVVYPWVRTYENTGAGYSVQQTTDGGYIATGWGWQEGSGIAEELLLLKTDSSGNEEWRRYYTGEYGAVGRCVRQTTDGGYIITGDKNAADLWLLKTDENGDTLWTKTYGWWWEDVGRWVEQTSDGGYIISGTSQNTGTDWHLWLLKTDEKGDTLFTQIYNFCSHGYCVRETSNGYILATNYGLVKTDSDGDTLWTYEKIGWYASCDVSGDGYVFATTMWGSFGRRDIFLIKINEDGDSIWGHSWGGEDEDYSYDVQQTKDGGYIISGKPWTLIKTDEYGDTLWTRKYDVGYSVQQTKDGGYITCGYTWVGELPNVEMKVSLTKTDSLGYAGVAEEPPVTTETNPDWHISPSIGPQITLRYTNRPEGFQASVFNAAGQKVGEARSTSPSGTITWGINFQSGVYFVREESNPLTYTQKVILLR